MNVKVKALQDFNYYNNNGYFEVKKDDVFEVDEDTFEALRVQGLVKIFTNENKIKREV
jgi:hypothetical protein